MTTTLFKVRKDGRYITSARRSLRRLPDGRTGVSWDGTVYPLHEPGPYIELTDVGCRWYHTSPWEAAADEEQTSNESDAANASEVAQPITFCFDYSGRHAYIMMSCSRAERDALFPLLSHWQLTLLGYGPASRPASDGQLYDWYLRLSHEHAKQFEENLKAWLKTGADPAYGADEGDDALATKAEEEASETISDATNDPAPALSTLMETLTPFLWPEAPPRSDEEDAQDAMLQELRQQVQQWSDLAKNFQSTKHQLGDLAAELQPYPASGHDSSSQGQQPSAETLFSQLREHKEKIQSLQQAVAQQVAEYEELFKLYDEKCSQSSEQGQLVRQLEAKAHKLTQRLDRITRFTEEFVADMFPDCEFLRDSLRIIVDELRKPTGFIRRLSAFLQGNADAVTDTVRRAEGWKELHFSTGENDSGRFYVSRNGNRFRILVSFKEDQLEDIEWLRKCG